MLNKNTFSVLAMISVFSLVIGCGKTASVSSNDQTANQTPVTLTLFVSQGSNEVQSVQKTIDSMLKTKYPNITINYLIKDKTHDYPDLINAGQIPDIVLESSSYTNQNIMKYGMQYDLTPLIQKYKFDLNRLDQNLLLQIENSGDGKLYGLPFTGSNMILFYNKDIFDKFGVSYPKDGMTWDQVYNLATQLTRVDQGQQYSGFQTNAGLNTKYNQLSLNWMDANDQATVTSDQWVSLFSNLKRFFDIPGNPYGNLDDFPIGKMARALSVSGIMPSWTQRNPQLNWDIVSAPAFPQAPRVGFQPIEYSFFITQASKYKDEDFKVISYLLSDEVQSALSKQGIISPLTSKSIQQVYAQDIPQEKGKNVGSIYYNSFPTPPKVDSLTYVVNPVATAFTDMLSKNLDVISTLSQLADTINKQVTTAKQQNK
ncbi:MAG: transporter substrate-binding protein [Bacilli bacterium]|nr:transporter substrate-binding protein [Bacilli bacterium]